MRPRMTLPATAPPRRRTTELGVTLLFSRAFRGGTVRPRSEPVLLSPRMGNFTDGPRRFSRG
jgi:hypothetical protein